MLEVIQLCSEKKKKQQTRTPQNQQTTIPRFLIYILAISLWIWISHWGVSPPTCSIWQLLLSLRCRPSAARAHSPRLALFSQVKKFLQKTVLSAAKELFAAKPANPFWEERRSRNCSTYKCPDNVLCFPPGASKAAVSFCTQKKLKGIERPSKTPHEKYYA